MPLRRAPVVVETALAFVAGAVGFVFVAVPLAAVDSDAFAVVFGALTVVAMVAIAHYGGAAYAVPPAVAALLAYDWFVFPPTHAHEFPDSTNLSYLLLYLSVSAFVGELAAHAGRRAASADAARARLVDEQAALRRVATLVASDVPPAEVFAAVAEEAGRILGVDATHLGRYEPGRVMTTVGRWSKAGEDTPLGTRSSLAGDNVSSTVLVTGRSARQDSYDDAEGPVAELLRSLGIRSSVGVPIQVEGRLWGVMVVSSRSGERLAPTTEARTAAFTELAAMAIANSEARADLAASRARLLVAADDERRRVVRDLHDGAQQRLVHTVVTLKLAQELLEDEPREVGALVAEALEQAQAATAELRELAHGILPVVLGEGGLQAGVRALAGRMSVPVANHVEVGRLPSEVEATAYFVVAEALTNIAKHARAGWVEVTASVHDDVLDVAIRDDGVGGARREGSGLVGLGDRLAALDGVLEVESPDGGGTVITARIPLLGDPGSRREPQAAMGTAMRS
jgi:signal transduction histidine kinase